MSSKVWNRCKSHGACLGFYEVELLKMPLMATLPIFYICALFLFPSVTLIRKIFCEQILSNEVTRCLLFSAICFFLIFV